jgi:RNA polymerase sigma-70 factor (ECF subfamily)
VTDPIDTSFAAAVEPLRGALRLHCYRMLGSSADSDDLVQETLLAADLAPAADPAARVADPLDEVLWLEPVPDTWLAEAPDPEAHYTLRESVALAFVAALQVLSPPQRAALLLRDVVGLSADEAAAALDQSVAATHSALHRARAAVDEKVARRDPASFATSPADAAVLAAYVRAIADRDVDAMIALMHDDMQTTMPPSPTWIAGKAASEVFYRRMFAGWQPGEAAVVPVGASGQHGFTFHRGGVMRAVEVVELRGGRIAAIHHFMQPALLPLFGAPSARARLGG